MPESITARAVAAASDAGRDLGLTVTDPRVLHDGFSVLVHLAPAPVVVRVPTFLPPDFQADLAAQAARQQGELDAVAWLADHGHPVVAPSPLTPLKPIQRDGFSMTFWQLVEQKDVEPDYVRNSALTANLHAALRDYPGELPFLSSVDESISQGLTDLKTHPGLLAPADLDRAQREWKILEPVFGSRAGFEAAFPGTPLQTIHGDSPPYNIISTPTGELYADFELVTLGPVEWDLTLVGPESEAAYNAAAASLGLRPLGDRLLRAMDAVRLLQVISCLALVPQLADDLAPMIDHWRTTPLAGGLEPRKQRG